jgi:hypothetical protein
MIDELQRAGCDGATLTLGCCSTRYVPFISCLPASSTGCARSKIAANKSGAEDLRRFQLQTGATKRRGVMGAVAAHWTAQFWLLLQV